jgi:signal transduction histidine kinase/DNA-binding response OmpR family regulator
VIVDQAAFDSLAHASREFFLASDRDGRVTYVDGRGRRLLGFNDGDTLRSHCAPGCETKLDDLLVHALGDTIDEWEVPFVVGDRPVTVSLSSRPHDGGAVFIGHVIPEQFVSSLRRVNSELSESNQGILSMHAELSAGLEHTRQDNEIKARLVANLSHELRTPLHSILGLAELLSSGADGTLDSEQAKQVSFIRASAEELLTLINDVLDIGQLESGHARLRITEFDLQDFVSSLRGALRPLVPERGDVALVLEDPPRSALCETDRNKLSQILRNLVSNALKFTERGEVRVTTEIDDDHVRFRVRDTGIGVSPADQAKIFEEYGQIESHLQERIKGTGLGLPLSRRLATSLGGTLRVESAAGQGSVFILELPLHHDEAKMMADMVERSRSKAPDAASILVVEDDRRTLFLYEKYLVMAGFHVMPARTVAEAELRMKTQRPAAIVLDVMLEGDASWGFLARVKNDPATREIPVLVVTVTNRADKARALGADEFWLKPVNQELLLRKLKELARTGGGGVRVLVIDDDPTARYIIRHHLATTPYTVFEAATGDEGVAAAREHRPDVILLDFLLQGATAFDVIDELKADPTTRGIPIIIVTSQVLDAVEQDRLLEEADSVISKRMLSRELAINRIRDALRAIGRGRPEEEP